MEEGLEEPGMATLEEVPTISACPVIQITLHMNQGCKGGATYMELNISHIQEDHSELFMITMSPVPCAMLQ